MYEPREDSELLASVLTRYACGRVLDIGTGSGILAQIAYDQGLPVLAVDRDRSVLAALKHKPFSVRYSDRFSAVHEKYDTIVCNPPYLPQDKHVQDSALYGGKKGYEYICALIAEAKQHLTLDGQFLFLISTLTKPSVVEKTLFEHGYAWTIVSREKLFMEELLVYRATLVLGEPALVAGKGKRSVVYRTRRGAVKVMDQDRVSKEAQLLRAVNKLGIGPRYKTHHGNQLVMMYIAGEPFNIFVERTGDVTVMRALWRQAKLLDDAGIKKKEFGRPGTNVLVTKQKKVVLLDFERSIYTKKPNNVTQLATYLSRVLHRDVKKELTIYKKTYSAAAFAALEHALFTNTLSHSHSK